MDLKNSADCPCPIARSLNLLGDAWSMLILRDANAGMTRFEQFKKSLGIAPTMLTKRLAVLTEENLLEKRQYSERPPRDEYVLTQAGRDFLLGTQAPRLRLHGAAARRGNRHRNTAPGHRCGHRGRTGHARHQGRLPGMSLRPRPGPP